MGLRRSISRTVFLGLTVQLASCGMGHSEAPPGRTAANRLSQTLGIDLRPVQPGASASLINVTATFAGGNGQQSLALVVFDSPTATRQLLGNTRGRSSTGLVVFARGRMLVIYTSATRRDPTAIARKIDTALNVKNPTVR